MRLDINYRKNSVKNKNTWRLNNTLLNNQEITEEMKTLRPHSRLTVSEFTF